MAPDRVRNVELGQTESRENTPLRRFGTMCKGVCVQFRLHTPMNAFVHVCEWEKLFN